MKEEHQERISIITEKQRTGTELISEPGKSREGVITNIRLPRAVVASIDEWIDQEMFRSRSDFLVTAARHYLLYLADKNIRPSKYREL
jgi:hypothetical protein